MPAENAPVCDSSAGMLPLAVSGMLSQGFECAGREGRWRGPLSLAVKAAGCPRNPPPNIIASNPAKTRPRISSGETTLAQKPA